MALLVLLAGAMLVGMPHRAGAETAQPALVVPATATDEARYSLGVRRSDAGVVRQRPVGVDFDVLDDAGGMAPTTLRVDLFDDRSVTLVKSRLERHGATSYTWYGKPADSSEGFAVLTVVDGSISGTLELGGMTAGMHGHYQLQSTRDGLTLLREIDGTTFPEDHPGGGEPMAPHANLKSLPREATRKPAGDALQKSDSAATIDVMVVYSNQTAAAAGTAIGAQIQQAVDTANLVYANSGITTRLRLVHYEQVGYDESGNFTTDLDRLTNGTDGYMDGVPALRNLYGADLVSLFVENAQYCGYGWIGPDPDYAFSVINRSCASGNYSFPHELGHNFGARHDAYVDPASTPYAYGHGWVDVAQRWRDVMAYNDACAASGVSCARIPYLSNPNLTYGSAADPLGSTTTADAVRVHNQNALAVANFRPTAGSGTPPPACTYALSPTSISVPAAGASGTTTLATGSGCTWNASSSAGWVTISSATSGTGAATVGYAAAANSGAARSANLSIGGQTFVVTQAGAPLQTAAVARISVVAIDFGSVSVGKASGTRTATVTNAGGGTLTVSSLQGSGANAGDFVRKGTCAAGTTLAAGQGCTLAMTFKPTASGARSATLAVSTSGGAVTLALTGTGKTAGHK